MSSNTYYLDISGVTGVTGRVADLNQKISIDLQIPDPNSITVNGSNIEIYYVTDINDFQRYLLAQLCRVLIYDQITGTDVFRDDLNVQSRKTFRFIGSPTQYHDIKSGYSVGSYSINNMQQVFMCTDATENNAVWELVNTPSPIFSVNFNKSTATPYYTYSNSVYKSVLTIPFAGTNFIKTPTSITLVCSVEGGAIGNYLLIDNLNGNIISNGSWDLGTDIIPYSLKDVTLSNIPATATTLDLSIRRQPGSSGKVNIYSFSIN